MNTQLNTISKNGKIIIAKYYNAKHSIADKSLRTSESVRNLSNIVVTDREDLQKLENGEKGILRSKSEILASIETNEKNLANKKEELKAYRDSEQKSIDNMYALFNIDKKAYKDFSEDDIKAVFINLFKSIGIALEDDISDRLMTAIGGKKENNNGNKYKSGFLNGKRTFSDFLKVASNEIADIFVEKNMLPLYKYEFVPKNQREKK